MYATLRLVSVWLHRVTSDEEKKKRPVDPFAERAREKERGEKRLKEELERARKEQQKEVREKATVKEDGKRRKIRTDLWDERETDRDREGADRHPLARGVTHIL